MKLVAAAAASAFIVHGAMCKAVCPNPNSSEDWDQIILNDDTLIFKYALVLASASSDERSILCARLESDMESYIGFGISPGRIMTSGAISRGGKMSGGQGIIGLPDAGTVKKYILGNVERLKLMPDEKQTLMNTNITQADGKTYMEFTKYLMENGEHEILTNGDNVFLYAMGSMNELGFHRDNMGAFTVDFEIAGTSPKTIPAPPSPTATQPSGALVRNVAYIALGVGAILSWLGI